MITHTTVRARAQDRLADLHDQARRDALARAARRARRARRPYATHPAAALLAALTRRARRPGPAPGSLVAWQVYGQLATTAADLGALRARFRVYAASPDAGGRRRPTGLRAAQTGVGAAAA